MKNLNWYIFPIVFSFLSKKYLQFQSQSELLVLQEQGSSSNQQNLAAAQAAAAAAQATAAKSTGENKTSVFINFCYTGDSRQNLCIKYKITLVLKY